MTFMGVGKELGSDHELTVDICSIDTHAFGVLRCVTGRWFQLGTCKKSR